MATTSKQKKNQAHFAKKVAEAKAYAKKHRITYQQALPIVWAKNNFLCPTFRK